MKTDIEYRVERIISRYEQMSPAVAIRELAERFEEAYFQRDQLYTDLDDANDCIRELQERLEKYEPEMTAKDRESLDNTYGY